MKQKTFYGPLTPSDFASVLVSHFNRGNYQVQAFSSGDNLVVQLATTQYQTRGGQTALTVNLIQVEDGVLIQVGQQAWFGVAASLGKSALSALFNPLSLLSNLDDIAQDFESIQLHDEIWQVIDQYAKSNNVGQRLSLKMRRVVCSYCGIANKVGDPACIGCGAPLGEDQPVPCIYCGYLFEPSLKICPNCGKPYRA